MIYCKDCLNDGNCINPGYYNASLRSECFRDKNGEKLKPSVAEILNSQPIQKAPFQMTEEEARVISKILVCDSETCKYVDNDCVECRYYKLKQAGYIRKSALVELVEEAEKILNNDSDYYTPHDIGIVAKGFKALKKDHPEFGGKK